MAVDVNIRIDSQIILFVAASGGVMKAANSFVGDGGCGGGVFVCLVALCKYIDWVGGDGGGVQWFKITTIIISFDLLLIIGLMPLVACGWQ